MFVWQGYSWVQVCLILFGALLMLVPLAVGFARPDTTFARHKGKMVFTYAVGLTFVCLGRQGFF